MLNKIKAFLISVLKIEKFNEEKIVSSDERLYKVLVEKLVEASENDNTTDFYVADYSRLVELYKEFKGSQELDKENRRVIRYFQEIGFKYKGLEIDSDFNVREYLFRSGGLNETKHENAYAPIQRNEKFYSTLTAEQSAELDKYF